MDYRIFFTRQAYKDLRLLPPKLKQKLRTILEEIIGPNPHSGKKLLGDLQGNYSYRLTLKDRIVYSIDEDQKIIYIKRARTHYGE